MLAEGEEGEAGELGGGTRQEFKIVFWGTCMAQ